MDIHFYVYIYIYMYIYMHTFFPAPQKRDVEITKLPGTFDLTARRFCLEVGWYTSQCWRHDWNCRGGPWRRHSRAVTLEVVKLPRPAFVENLLDDDKSLHTQFPKKSCYKQPGKNGGQGFPEVKECFFFLKGHFRLAYSNDPTTPDYWGPPKKFWSSTFLMGI